MEWLLIFSVWFIVVTDTFYSFRKLVLEGLDDATKLGVLLRFFNGVLAIAYLWRLT